MLILACSSALNCKTCTADISECTSCDTTATTPRFLRSDDKYCVLQTECDQSMPYFWDEIADECAGQFPIFTAQIVHAVLIVGRWDIEVKV